MVKNLHAMQETQDQSLGRSPGEKIATTPPPVFMLAKSHGQRTLAGYNPWGQKELDTPEGLKHFFFPIYKQTTNRNKNQNSREGKSRGIV